MILQEMGPQFPTPSAYCQFKYALLLFLLLLLFNSYTLRGSSYQQCLATGWILANSRCQSKFQCSPKTWLLMEVTTGPRFMEKRHFASKEPARGRSRRVSCGVFARLLSRNLWQTRSCDQWQQLVDLRGTPKVWRNRAIHVQRRIHPRRKRKYHVHQKWQIWLPAS